MQRYKYILFILCAPLLAACSTLCGVGKTSHDRAVSVEGSAKTDIIFYEAISKSQEEQYDDMFMLLSYCYQLDSLSPSVNYSLASLYYMLNQKRRVEPMLKYALAADPNNFWYNNSLVTYYVGTHRIDDAIELLERMIHRFPTNSELLLRLAEMYDNNGDYRKELVTINRYAHIEDLEGEVALHRFNCYLKLDMMDSAYVALGPQFNDVISLFFQEVGNNAVLAERLISLCDVAIEADRTNSTAYHYSAIGNMMFGRDSISLERIAVGIENVSDSVGLANLYSLRASYYGERNEESDLLIALSDYEMALKYEPNSVVIQNNYAYLLSILSIKLDVALAMSANTLLDNPDEATYLDTYASILYAMGRYAEALEYIERAVGIEPNNVTIVEHYGTILFMCGKEREAIEQWGRAIDLGGERERLLGFINKSIHVEYSK